MTMQETNYCRQILADLDLAMLHYNVEPVLIESTRRLADAVKFTLPEGGVTMNDFELRGIGDGPLNLPFENIALEFPHGIHPTRGKMVKAIVSCQQLSQTIRITSFSGMSGDEWGINESFEISSTDHTDKTNHCWEPKVPAEGKKKGVALWVLLFLNALACSNVRIESRPPRKAGKKIKGALPFDTYHVLTIDVGRKAGTQQAGEIGSGRSPREHLRRGHIRRLADGRRVWVNATVVAAEKSAGRIKKDYRVVNSGATP